MMNPKITAEHLERGATVYVRQSTPGQVIEHTESQRRQYALAESARTLGFISVNIIDDDLGRSGSGMIERPGFQKLVAAVCAGSVGAVFCIEASRLARNGRDWQHLIDLCALTATLVIDHDGTYDPRVVNDRLLLGLKGTMAEYELSLLRQRGLAARDSKAKRGELRFLLPPGYCWNELGRIEMDPDQRVVDTIRLVFKKFRELGSARQVLLWAVDKRVQLPVIRQTLRGPRVEWKSAEYSVVVEMLHNPIYAGAYAFGRTTQRTKVVEGRARKTNGHHKPMHAWNVLIRDRHPGYITWAEFEENQQMIAENAHMKKRMSRKSARGGRALLTGLIRCGRCGHMMRVFYGMQSSHAHRYQCPGSSALATMTACIGIGGVRVDRSVAAAIVEAVSAHAVEAAILAAAKTVRAEDDVRQAVFRELEEARYETTLAARRYECVDPAKRLVARELEARWNASLERVAHLEARLKGLDEQAAARVPIDSAALMTLAQDLPAAWNAASTDPRTKQRLARILIQETVIDLDDKANEVVITVHWTGGRHTEMRVARSGSGRYPADLHPSPIEVMRKLGGRWPDRQLAVTMNRMRCKSADGKSWTTLRVCELREKLKIKSFDPTASKIEIIGIEQAALRLKVSIGSVYRLIREGLLPATQLMHSAPWEIPLAALETDAVKIGVRKIIARRPQKAAVYQEKRSLKLPGF
jgi:DNA invertase Pin-like site-specific DNA recombinase